MSGPPKPPEFISPENAFGDLHLFGGLVDPTVNPQQGGPGDLWIQVGKKAGDPIGLFQKKDYGKTTNWAVFLNQQQVATATVESKYPFETNVSQGDIVYVNSSAKVDRALADDSLTTFSIGVVEQFNGNQARVLTIGKTSGFYSGFTPGQPVFLSATNPGQPTQTAPSGGGQWLQMLGVAASQSQIELAIQQPMERS